MPIIIPIGAPPFKPAKSAPHHCGLRGALPSIQHRHDGRANGKLRIQNLFEHTECIMLPDVALTARQIDDFS
jgi:hypothetical protein